MNPNHLWWKGRRSKALTNYIPTPRQFFCEDIFYTPPAMNRCVERAIAIIKMHRTEIRSEFVSAIRT